MKETFQYKGYSAELIWSVARGEVRATAQIMASPEAARKLRCNCSIEGFVSVSSAAMIDENLSPARHIAFGKSLAIEVVKKLEKEIDGHLQEGCFTPN